MTKMRTFHIAQSVDVDQRSDAYLRDHVCPGLLFNGEPPTVERLRIACHNARIEGKRVLPPCDETLPDGSCAGHAEIESPIRETTDWLQPGKRVDYSSVIGEPPTQFNCIVLERPFFADAETWCCFIDGVGGWVACAALSPSPDKFDEGLWLIAEKMRGEHGHQDLFNAGGAEFVLRARDYITRLEVALANATAGGGE